MNLNETNQYGCVFFPVVIAGEEQTVSWVQSGLEFYQANIKNEAGARQLMIMTQRTIIGRGVGVKSGCGGKGSRVERVQGR